jgi:hypothetical protein
MRSGIFLTLSAAAWFFAAPATAQADGYEDAVAQIIAGSVVAEVCDGIGYIGGPARHDYFMTATALGSAQQGLSKQRLRRMITRTVDVDVQIEWAKAVLAKRVRNVKNKSQVCALGRSVAGKTTDPLGRFLVR